MIGLYRVEYDYKPLEEVIEKKKLTSHFLFRVHTHPGAKDTFLSIFKIKDLEALNTCSTEIAFIECERVSLEASYEGYTDEEGAREYVRTFRFKAGHIEFALDYLLCFGFRMEDTFQPKLLGVKILNRF